MNKTEVGPKGLKTLFIYNQSALWLLNALFLVSFAISETTEKKIFVPQCATILCLFLN